MSRILFGIPIILALVLSGPAVAAQSGGDLERAADAAMAVDPAALVAALDAPITDSDLPAGFVAPVDGVPQNQEVVEAFASGFTNIGMDAESVVVGFDTDPDLVPGLISAAMFTYIIVEDEVTSDNLDDFATGIEQGLATPAAGTPGGTVETIELFDTDAILVTLESEESNGVFVTVQMIAIPVGNVMVLSTLVVADEVQTDAADILALTEDLAVAGVEYLGKTAEGI